MAKTIIFGNQKGGVAKTTSTYNVAMQLALRDYRVLMVDSDPQASLTIVCGKAPEDFIGRNLHTLLYELDKKVDVHDCILSLNDLLPENSEGSLSLIPCEIQMAAGDTTFASRPKNTEYLKMVLNKIKDEYDYICIDCPPSLGMISLNDIFASDFIVGCVEPTYQAYRGISEYIKTLFNYINNYEIDTKFIGIIIAKATHSKDSFDLVDKYEKEFDVLGKIPLSVEVTKGEIDGVPVSTRKPGHLSSLMYADIAEKIVYKIANLEENEE